MLSDTIAQTKVKNELDFYKTSSCRVKKMREEAQRQTKSF